MAVNSGIGDHHALGFGLIGRPCAVLLQVMAQIARKHRAVQRADGADLQLSSLGQCFLHLQAVFAHNAKVIPARLTVPLVVFGIQCAEFAESIGAEQHLVGSIIGKHHLGPVNERCKHKLQGVPAQSQGFPIGYFFFAALQRQCIKILQHGEGARIGNHCCLRIFAHKCGNACRMVRLHVLHDQIVRCAALQSSLQVLQPLLYKVSVYGIHNRNLIVQDHIRIVRHALGHNVLALKKIDFVIVYTNIPNVFCDLHK